MNGTWFQGPFLNSGYREGAQCGLLRSANATKILVAGAVQLRNAVGARLTLDSVELLNVPDPFTLESFLLETWEDGPLLPKEVAFGATIDNPLTGTLLLFE